MKKLLSLTAALMLVLTLTAFLPWGILKADAAISKVEITMNKPKDGDNAVQSADKWVTSITNGVTVSNIRFVKDMEMHQYMSSTDTFESGKTYYAIFYFSMYGYSFNESTDITVNGKKAEFSPYDSTGAFSGFSYEFVVGRGADTVNVSVVEPVIGKNPDLTSSTDIFGITPKISLPEGGFGVNMITYADSNGPLSADDKFEAGKKYTAVIDLYCEGNTYLTKDTIVLVNGLTAKTTAEDFDCDVVYTIEFEAKEPMHLDRLDIEITAPKAGEMPDTNIKSFSPDGAANIYKSMSGPEIGMKLIVPNNFVWFEHEKGGAGSEVFEAFKEGHTYTAELEMTSGYIYAIDSKTKVYVNGVEAKPSEYSDYNGTIFYSADFDLSSFSLGDVNADKKIDIEDAVKVINHVNGVKVLTEDENKRADIDGNKKIDIEDAVSIIAHVNGVKIIK